MSDRPPTREDGPEAPASPKPSIVEVAAWLRRAAEEGHELDGGTTAAEPEGPRQPPNRQAT